jgi:hypothetical protein
VAKVSVAVRGDTTVLGDGGDIATFSFLSSGLICYFMYFIYWLFFFFFLLLFLCVGEDG